MIEENPSVPESKIDKETAEIEFDRWASAMRINMNRVMDENDRRDLLEDKSIVVQGIMEGRVTLDDDDRMVFQPESGNPITFYRPKGGDLVVMDKKKKNADIGKINASLASVCRVPEQTFIGMYINDLQMCQTIWSLFLV